MQIVAGIYMAAMVFYMAAVANRNLVFREVFPAKLIMIVLPQTFANIINALKFPIFVCQIQIVNMENVYPAHAAAQPLRIAIPKKHGVCRVSVFLKVAALTQIAILAEFVFFYQIIGLAFRQQA